jgi:hypothetical protein
MFREYQSLLVAKGWARPKVNKAVGRICRMFKWATSHDLRADVTRNQRRRNENELMADVRDWIERRKDHPAPKTATLSKSPRRGALESCKAV